MFSIRHIPTHYLLRSLILLVLAYFIYHIYHGDRGLISQEALRQEHHKLSKIHQNLKEKRIHLENKITSLGAGDGQIDPDLLSEYAKRMGYIMPNEVLITE